MPLCGSSTCGCALSSEAAISGAINGYYPTILTSGAGTALSPWVLGLDTDWAAEVATAAALADTNETDIATLNALLATAQAAGGSTNYSGITSTPTQLAAADATFTVINGQDYLVEVFGTFRFGAGATSGVTLELKADSTAIVTAYAYNTWISNQRFPMTAKAIWTPSGTSFDMELFADTTAGSMQTQEATARLYGYSITPVNI